MTGTLSVLAVPTGKAGPASSPEDTSSSAKRQGASSVAQFMMLLGGEGGDLTLNGKKVSIQSGGPSPLGEGDAEVVQNMLHRLSGSLVETGGDLQIRSELASGLESFEAAVLSFLKEQVPQQSSVDGESAGGEGSELPEDLLDVVADILGGFVAAFDAKHGTDFSSRLSQSFGTGGGQEGVSILASLPLDKNAEKVRHPAAFLISEAVTRASKGLGVERGMTNAQPTATQTLLMFQPGAVPQQAKAAPAGPALDAVWTSAAPAEKVMEEFLGRASASAQSAKSILEQIAAPNGAVSNGSPSMAGLGNAAPALGAMSTHSFDQPRLDMVATLHHSHSDAGEISRFEDALSHASKARSDHVGQQSLQPRFANLILSQMKNATFSENRMRIELAPRGLGEISISVETDPSGRVQALVRVENPQVLDLLRTDRAQLESLLAEKGFDMAGGSLDFEEFDQGEESGEGGSGQADVSDDLSEALSEESESAAVIGNDHLDILT